MKPMPYSHSAPIHGTPGRIVLIMALLPLLMALHGCNREAAGTDEATATASQKIVLKDALGEQIVLDGPARRVISLAPNLTEIVYAIGGGSSLVGRTAYCNYPPEALAVESIGDMLTTDYEKILSRRPDLVLMAFAGNSHANYRKLKEIGIQAFALHDTTIAGMTAAIADIGTLLGRKEEAATVNAHIHATIDSIQTLAHGPGSTPITTFIVIDRAPLMTVSWGFLVEAIRIAGGENIATGSLTAYPLYSREELLRRDPEVILVPGRSTEDIAELLRLYPEWKRLRAIRQNRIYVLPPDVILRPGPRITESVALLYQALHGANPDSLMAATLAQ